MADAAKSHGLRSCRKPTFDDPGAIPPFRVKELPHPVALGRLGRFFHLCLGEAVVVIALLPRSQCCLRLPGPTGGQPGAGTHTLQNACCKICSARWQILVI